ANQADSRGWAVGAFLLLLLGATGVFVELQDALNTIWRVRRLPGHGLRQFIRDRMLSFAMIISIGFLLLVSLVISAALSGFGSYLSGWVPAIERLWHAVDGIVSFGVVTLLFALLFKILP